MNAQLLCFSLFCTQSVLAYPPAPPTTLYGSVRGEFGFSLTDDKTSLLLLAGDKVIARTPIGSALNFGENYRLTLPVDFNPANGPYRASAVTPNPTATYSFVAERNGSRIPVIKADLSNTPVSPQAAANIRVDFILGSDIDDDGLPDAWENFQASFLEDYDGDRLDAFSATGDFDGDGLSDRDEYIAGTFAGIFADGFNFRVVNKAADGSAELTFLAVQDKTYRIEATTDLKTWVLATFTPVVESAETTASFTADNTAPINVVTEPRSDGDKVIYRLHVD